MTQCREIKFRAWDKEQNELFSFEDIESSDKEGILMWGEIFSGKEPQIILMQFTGLKDKRGKEIYEGDIVVSSYYKEPFLVEYDVDGGLEDGSLNPEERIVGFRLPFDEGLEIIGNVWDNPELLK